MTKKTTDRLRFGIVGVGRHGERYVNHLLQGDAPHATIVALHRRNEAAGRAFAEERGLRFHADLEGLLGDPDVDAVIITTPTKHHAPAAVAAAEAGKHVLCEKPMARTVAECREMIDAAREGGVQLGIGQTLRYTPMLGALRDRLGEVGDLYALNGCMRQEKTPTEWHLDRDIAGGGAAIEIGVHVFDTIRFVTGANPTRVFGEARDTYGAGVETFASGVLWLDNGATAAFDVAKTVDGRLTRFEAVGSEGELLADLSANRFEKIVGRERIPIEPPENAPGIPLLVEAFATAVLNGEAPPITGEDGLATIAICEAFYRSVESGAIETVSL